MTTISHASTVGQELPPINLEARQILDRVQSTLFGESTLSAARYEIVRKLGVGGMGVVYEAYDPVLDCKIALKQIRPDLTRAEGFIERLRHEARAMASLRPEPHIVTLYDFFVQGDLVFVVMELVDGTTLRTWQAARPPVAAVLDKYLQAGLGLAAAHRKHLVHRDFKPDNVLVDRGGIAKVSDFGLALVVPGEHDDAGAGETDAAGAGAVAGTLRYMSPEQRRGQQLDPRSDQFSFCVALWEALSGEHPFHVDASGVRSGTLASPTGDTLPNSLQVVWDGPLRSIAPEVSVPRHVLAALTRGLATRPHERFATMDELLAALRGPPRSARGIVGGVAIAGAAAIAVVVALRPVAADPRAMCARAGERLAEAWSPSTREHVRDRIVAGGAPGAATAAVTIVSGLAAQMDAIVGMSVAACEATHVRGEQSLALLDLRMACLDRRSEELRATIALFDEEPAPDTLALIRATESLPAVDSCADTTRLREAWPLPTEPALRAAALETRGRLVGARAMRQAGRFARAEQLARAAGSSPGAALHLPFAAEAAFIVGATLQEQARLADAERELVRAYHLADAAHDDALRVDALYRRVRNAEESGQLAAATALLADLEAAARRSGTPEARGQYVEMARQLASARGELARAVELARELVAVHTQSGHAMRLAEATANLGALLLTASRFEEADQQLRRAQEMFAGLLGPENPNQARQLGNLGGVRFATGHPDEALRLFQDALAILVAAGLGDQSEALSVRANVALAWDALGRHDEAYAELERLLVVDERVLGPGAELTGRALYNLGDNRLKAGDLPRALEWLRKAVAQAERHREPGHLDTANARWALAEALLEHGEPDAALTLLLLALPVQLAQTGPDSDDTAFTHASLARAYLELGRPAEALVHAEACQAHFADSPEPLDRGNVRVYLARALAALGRDPERVAALADQARADYLAAKDAAGLAAVERLGAPR